jgi:nucleolar GTP-binding protein
MRARLEEMAQKAGAELVPMSNISEENVSVLKCKACDKLLEARVDAKLSAGRMKDDILSRITVAVPKPRDGVTREVFIPDSVAQSRSGGAMQTTDRVTEKQLMIANGGAGVYACDYRKYYIMEDDEWRYDTIPEIMDGKNVMDFFDPDIEERLKALDDEEAELEARGAYAPEEDDEDDIDEEEMLMYDTIKDVQAVARKNHHLATSAVPRKIALKSRDRSEAREALESHGLEADGVMESTRGRKRTRSTSVKPSRSASRGGEDMDVDESEGRQRSSSAFRRGSNSKSSKAVRQRSQSAVRGPKTEVVSPAQIRKIEKMNRSKDRYLFKSARASESDREHYPKLVKHLNSGKRSLGTSTIGR